MRLIVALCEVQYYGRGETHLSEAVRLIMIKRDGSVSVHSDDRAFKPLNWMLPPCTIEISEEPSGELEGNVAVWTVKSRQETLTLYIRKILSDTEHSLAEADPGLARSWTEPHIQAWLATHVEEFFGKGWQLVQREAPTGAGPVDLLLEDPECSYVAVEVKRTATMNAVDQVCRYVEALTSKHPERKVRGMLVAITVKPRAQELAHSRQIEWVEIPATSYRT